MFVLIILIVNDEKQQHLLRIVKPFRYENKLLLDSGMNVFESDKKFHKKKKAMNKSFIFVYLQGCNLIAKRKLLTQISIPLQCTCLIIARLLLST